MRVVGAFLFFVSFVVCMTVPRFTLESVVSMIVGLGCIVLPREA